MGLIGFLVFGLIVGALARLLLPGKQKIGLVLTLVLGVIGSVIGGLIANALGTGDVFELNILGSVVAVVSAVALLAAAESAGIGAGDKRGELKR
ncbi:MAG: GlsB/YeaQ/YmgE family stress response membrane protein [Thermoleophilaceae bacterium]|nr:GlsB/YeaQ/YmgE family stress response membrane protein [Thermoleophilaceae bacterium]